MKLQIIETSDYILAVSDEKTLSVNGDYFLDYVNNNLHRWSMTGMHEGKSVWINKIIAYQPKDDAPDLEGVPLLPEIVVEDDVEKLAMDELKSKWAHLYISGYPKRPFPTNYERDLNMIMLGYYKAKSATKVYSEDDLRKAIKMAWEADSIDGTVDLNIVLHYGDSSDLRTKWTEDEIIQSLKQPKTPKWFVAEMDCGEVRQCMCETNNDCLKPVLKTTTINGNTYLVGTYLNQ